MSDMELQKTVAVHDQAIKSLKEDMDELKKDLKQILDEALKRWPPGLSVTVTLLSSLVTGLGVYLLTH